MQLLEQDGHLLFGKGDHLPLLLLRQPPARTALKHEEAAQLRQLDRAHGQVAQGAPQGGTHQGGAVDEAVRGRRRRRLSMLLLLLLLL